MDKTDNVKGSSYHYLKKAYHDHSILEKYTKLTDSEREGLLKIIIAKLSPKQVKVKIVVKASIQAAGGVEYLKHSFISAKNAIENPNDVSITLSFPNYIVECQGTDKEEMISKLNKVSEAIKTNILRYNGTYEASEHIIVGEELDKLSDPNNNLTINEDNSGLESEEMNEEISMNSEEENEVSSEGLESSN